MLKKASLAGDPTAERERHGHLVAAAAIATEKEGALPGVKMHRTQSPIERYAIRGSLSLRQSEAATDLRDDWEFGIIGAFDSTRRGAGGGPAGITDAQLDAATAYRQAVQAMGKSISAIVLPVVIGDAAGGEITVDTLARRRREDRKHIMGALKIGLDTLADHYASSPDRRRAAKYA